MRRIKKALSVAVVLLLVVGVGTALASGKEEVAGSEEAYFFTTTINWGERIPVEEQPDDPYFQYVVQQLGVGPLTHSWEWEGSQGYVKGLRLALAGGEKFDSLMPWDEILTAELIDSGTAIPLDDLLEEHAPEVLDLYSEEDLKIIRSQGNGSIYFLPRLPQEFGIRAGFIRKDWLKRVGMDVPKTRDELIAVYRAFKEQDANGNGDPNDEIPVSGRTLMRWCDDLFVMNGVAMYEGHPQWTWNPDKGILESEQVSDDMKRALEFIRMLIAEGLMDPVMPVQPASDWAKKITGGKVGHYFHLTQWIDGYTGFMADDPNPDETGLKYWDVMPYPPEVPGVGRQKNYFPSILEPGFVITKWAKKPELIVKWLKWSVSDEGYLFRHLGIPEVDWKWEDGKIQVINQQFQVGYNYSFYHLFTETRSEIIEFQTLGPLKVDLMDKVRGTTQAFDNLGMPVSVYKGFEDFSPFTAKMFREYGSKFVLGEVPVDSWDDYVSEWYEKGGEAVTERATKWYKELYGM
jgi:putative aldouronate transport system substrate-binding protein